MLNIESQRVSAVELNIVLTWVSGQLIDVQYCAMDWSLGLTIEQLLITETSAQPLWFLTCTISMILLPICHM